MVKIFIETEAQGSINDFHNKKSRSFNLMPWESKLSGCCFFFKEEGGDKGSLKEAIRNISHEITYLPSNPMMYKACEAKQLPSKRAAGNHGRWGRIRR